MVIFAERGRKRGGKTGSVFPFLASSRLGFCRVLTLLLFFTSPTGCVLFPAPLEQTVDAACVSPEHHVENDFFRHGLSSSTLVGKNNTGFLYTSQPLRRGRGRRRCHPSAKMFTLDRCGDTSHRSLEGLPPVSDSSVEGGTRNYGRKRLLVRR